MKWLVGLTITSVVPAASRADERPVIAEVPATAPFDASQLAAALRLRLPARGAPIRIRVVSTPDGARPDVVWIEVGGNVREVALRGSTGPDAARLVALAATDLLLEDLVVAAEAPLAPPAAPSQAVTIGALGGVAVWQYPIAGLGVDLAVARDTWLLALEAGGGVLDGPLRLTTGVIRFEAGTRHGAFDLRGGATAMPLTVGDGAGDATVLVAASASVRARVPIGLGVRGVLAGGIDLFATRTTYVLDGMPVLTTPRIAPWLAAGLEVAP
jgi:hypothetical protein